MTLAEIKTKNLDNLEIGARLREAREAQGLSIEKLAKFSGNIPAAIEKLENGEVLSPLVIADLAAILGVNPAWLLWGEK
jgi:transcriptional regulator with XRE-family HTH domain